jgi:acetyl-CoA synthetase/medium-chain acyl-CoA synthetase
MEEAAAFNFARDVLDAQARQRPEAAALWWVDESGREEKYSFRELEELSRRAAAFFHELGVRRGDRVLVVLPRIPQWWVGLLGLIRLGAVPIPGTTLLTERDIAYRIGAADVTAVLTDADCAAKVKDFRGVRCIAGGRAPEGWADFDAGVRRSRADFDPGPTAADDPGIIYFTSGTTGHAKMVLHTQASYGLGHEVTGRLWLDLRPGDVHWNMADTGWAKAAWSSFYGPWHCGACIFAVDSRGKFDPAAALGILERYPVTTWCAPPTALRLIIREDLSARRFPHLRHCVSAGEPLNPEVIEIWQKATGLTIYEGYGQTETVVLVGNFRSTGAEIRPGSMGVPTPGFVLGILDPEGDEVPAGEEGELAIRVRPNRPLGLFREYWRNDGENAARFQGDWYLTGDVAKRDQDGYFWFVGRADDVIKSSGYRIGPFEVESALIEHPDVVEAAVVGKPDAMRGQIVKAFVVLRKGCAPRESLVGELQEHCKRVTAPYRYPREIEFVAELPKTVSGKIRRVELRKRAREQAGGSGGRE